VNTTTRLACLALQDLVTRVNILHNKPFYTQTRTCKSPDDPSDVQRFWTLIGKVITQRTDRTKSDSDLPNIIVENLALLKRRRSLIANSDHHFATFIEALDAGLGARNLVLKLSYLII